MSVQPAYLVGHEPAHQTQPALAPYTGAGALSILSYNALPLASFFITSQVGPSQLAATYQLRLQHEEAEEEQTVDVHGVYTQVSPTLHIYININVCEYVRVRICVCRSL